ncbi:unnamed protein product [Spirodela intermedia]|uniref:Uncharacterized protein n=1 Tax=Spirodela intermedia TaxID=51605 RepID=A0A7I8JX08_SPIIN|nr:unnamed protein product [Spirodela intermedia]
MVAGKERRCTRDVGRLQDLPQAILQTLNSIGNDEEEIKEGINSFEIINCLQPIQRQSEKSLVYVEVEADEETVAEMVDSGATSNFISLEEVQRIGLKVEPTKTRFKAADSSTQSLIGE